MNWPFTSGDQNTGASTSASVLPMNIQGWFPLGWTDWISLPSKGLPRVFSSTTIQKHLFFITQPSSWSNSHIPTWLLEKWCVCVLSWVKLFAIPWTVACQSPLSIEFSRKKYWSGLLFPSPGHLNKENQKTLIMYDTIWYFPLCFIYSILFYSYKSHSLTL